MAQLEKIYEGTFFSSYSQLQMLDPLADEGPEWGRDSGETVFNAHGVAFTVRNDANVTVVVYRGDGKPGGRFVGAGTITVGTAGLEIGEIMDDKDLLDWPPGETRVAVYLHSRQPWSARKVSIVMTEVVASDRAPESAKASPSVAERANSIIGRILQPKSLPYYTAATALKRLGVEAIPALLEALRHPDDRVRAAAIHALGILREPRAVEPLIAALDDDAGEVRVEAIRWLGSFRDHRATLPLLHALGLPDPRLRMLVATSLGELRDPRAVSPLIARLLDDDEDLFVREQAARSLGDLRAREALPHLLNLLRVANEHFRYAIFQSLMAFGKAVAPILDQLLEDADPRMRQAAVVVLGSNRRQPPIDMLTRMLDDVDDSVRQSAVVALEQSFNPAALPALTRAARDPSPFIRHIAIQGLANVGDTSVLPLLTELRDTDNESGLAGYSIHDQAEKAIKFIQERIGQPRPAAQ